MVRKKKKNKEGKEMVMVRKKCPFKVVTNLGHLPLSSPSGQANLW